jgi:hypothetical protein
MRHQSKSHEQQPRVDPADPAMLLLYKQHLEKDRKSNAHQKRQGKPPTLVEVARLSFARWHLAARIWLLSVRANLNKILSNITAKHN